MLSLEQMVEEFFFLQKSHFTSGIHVPSAKYVYN